VILNQPCHIAIPTINNIHELKINILNKKKENLFNPLKPGKHLSFCNGYSKIADIHVHNASLCAKLQACTSAILKKKLRNKTTQLI